MKFSLSKYAMVLMICVLGLQIFPGSGYTQEAEGPATGFAMWVRFPVVSVRHIAASITGNPEFAVGYRGERFGLGAALGLMLVKGSDDFDSVSGTVFQIGPAGWIDFWESPDGMTRGNVALGVTFGNLSLTSENDFGDKSEASGTLVNFNAGVGGDHFLSPHFSIGMEGGFQGAFAMNLKEEGFSDELGISASGLYGLIRTMIVF